MKIGARVIKTGLAVIVALYVSIALHLQSPVFAAIAAVISIQPSVYRSITTFIEQVKANIIGAVIAIAIAFLLGTDPISVGLAVIVVILINLMLKYEKSISISVLTAIAIMESASDSFTEFAFQRFILIIIGMLAATLINALFIPPKHEGKIIRSIQTINEHITEMMLRLEENVYMRYIDEVRKNVSSLETLFEVYQEEVFFRRYPFEKKRALVHYKRMISLFRKEMKLLQYIPQIRRHPMGNDLMEKIKMVAAIQKQLLLDQIIDTHLKFTLDLKPIDPQLYRPVSLLFDIEMEVNKMIRYHNQRLRLQHLQTAHELS